MLLEQLYKYQFNINLWLFETEVVARTEICS